MRVRQRAQVVDELLFVARRQQRGQQDYVRHARGDRRDRRVAGVDEHQIGAHLFTDDALENAGLPDVRLDREYERQCPYVLTMKKNNRIPAVANTSNGALSML